MGQIADAIVPNLRTSITLGGLLLKDVKPEIFARFPTKDGKPVQTNHAAFNYGHLAIYPVKIMKLLGRDSAEAAVPAGWEDLFKAGAECKDDPSGTIYPKMDAVVAAYNRGYNTVLNALGSVPDSVLLAQNPTEGRFRDMCPTVGAAAAFLTMSHPMMHLGQVSAWRRMFGLGPVM